MSPPSGPPSDGSPRHHHESKGGEAHLGIEKNPGLPVLLSQMFGEPEQKHPAAGDAMVDDHDKYKSQSPLLLEPTRNKRRQAANQKCPIPSTVSARKTGRRGTAGECKVWYELRWMAILPFKRRMLPLTCTLRAPCSVPLFMPPVGMSGMRVIVFSRGNLIGIGVEDRPCSTSVRNQE
ncbi:hypothetical protein B0H17DRAFT_1135522 [Mycena rosella]|uniref:Uncharacterized protein n=1 Tax=Mycena rosella TaxID=1033263 RepID=A0AAD7GCT8_MYCRO|nr:hypothetical protein B0H17DRAFT_1135522 [Mycena rosella]